MDEIEKLKLAYTKADEFERQCKEKAAAAISEALLARRDALYKWMTLATARGGKDFPQTRAECTTLLARSNQSMKYVDRAFDMSFWGRLFS
jgi:hypothetical protein